MPNLRLSAKEAAASAQAFQHEMNAKRRMPKLARATQRSMFTPSFCIFNVGPWKHTKEFGDAGVYTIQGCPEGQPFVKMKRYVKFPESDHAEQVDWLPEISVLNYTLDEKQFGAFEEDGIYLAEQFIGVGHSLSPKYALTKFGVAIAEGVEPTKQELAKANRELDKTLLDYIKEARLAFSKGPSELAAIMREDKHIFAAHRLNMGDEPWLNAGNPRARQECPKCGTVTNDGVAQCPGFNCGWVFDQKKLALLNENTVGYGQKNEIAELKAQIAELSRQMRSKG